MHRLVAYAHDGVQRFAVDRSELLIGSGDGCDIRLPFAGVGHQHARLHATNDGVSIEDLGSRKGVVVNGRRVRSAELEVLDEIRLGSIALLLEDVVPERGEADEAIEEAPPEPVMTPERMLHHLARVSQWVLSDSASAVTLESLATALLCDFGGGVLWLFQGEEDREGIKFVISTNARWLGNGEEIRTQVEAQDRPAGGFVGELDGSPAWLAFRALRALDRPYLFALALPAFRPDEWSPLDAFHTLADQLVLGLVHHVGQFEPILFGRRQQADLALAPGLIVGESAAMKRVLAQLRAAIRPEVTVLLRGEQGVSKELLARSLHLSGPRSEGPFVTASSAGAKAIQLEADLFGAVVPGRDEPFVREGKLLQADGGTLYLDDVDRLPLALQDRLVRFLRSGEVEPVDGREAHAVDVRLITASAGALEASVARDQFRLDLAYRLSRFAIDVPALRDRREDLPLLIQAAVNHCCHQTGKRVQGITVKALEALAVHTYPGNLPELENIVRRLVYLCPSGRPIDESMLPEQVRLSTVKGLRPESLDELDLDKLVADTERAAIREALRRNGGNKSAASRQLGLSRNGLAMKMSRLGLGA